MNDWPKESLGQLISLEYGKPLPKAKRDPSGLYPAYGANGVKTRTNEALGYGDSLIIGRKGSAGSITRVSGVWWPLDVTYFVALKNPNLDIDYLHLALRQLNLPSLARGVKPGVNRNDVYELRIPLPSLSEQKEIVSRNYKIQDTVDQLANHITQQIKEARGLREAVLSERLSGSHYAPHVGALKNPAANEWPLAALADVAEVIAGQSPRGEFYNKTGIGKPFYQGKRAFGSRFVEPPSVWTSVSTKIAQAGDILMSVRAPVGPVNFAVEECCIGRGLAAIRAGKEIDNSFLFYYLRSPLLELAGAEGAVFDSINKSRIQSIRVPLPPLAQQKRIVAEIEELDSVLAHLEEQLAKQKVELMAFQSAALSEALGGGS